MRVRFVLGKSQSNRIVSSLPTSQYGQGQDYAASRSAQPLTGVAAALSIRHSLGFGIAAQIVRGEIADASLCGELLDYVPQLFGDFIAPGSADDAHTRENLSGFDACGRHPLA